jgi:chromosomal replication initiator protein
MINQFDLELDNDVIEYIANNCGSDIRNLENSVIRLVAYKITLNIEKVTIDIAREALEEYVTETVYKTNSIAKIVDVVAKYYNIDASMIKGKMRKKNIADARAIVMYLCTCMTEETLDRIGLELGGKNHATIIYSREKINEELKTNSKLQEEIKILKDKICE